MRCIVTNPVASHRNPVRSLAFAPQDGFTLIELLVVLAIVALLITIAVPRYFHSVDVAKETVLAENLLVVRESIDKFFGDTGRYPDSLAEMVEKKYLRTLPVDPITGSADSWFLVPPGDTGMGNVYDIRSGAPGARKDGIPFEEM